MMISIFLWVYCSSYIFSSEVSFHIFCPYLRGLSFYYLVVTIIYSLGTHLLSDIYFVNNFFHCVIRFFNFLYCVFVFQGTKVFSYNKVQFVNILWFMCLTFYLRNLGVHSKVTKVFLYVLFRKHYSFNFYILSLRSISS